MEKTVEAPAQSEHRHGPGQHGAGQSVQGPGGRAAQLAQRAGRVRGAAGAQCFQCKVRRGPYLNGELYKLWLYQNMDHWQAISRLTGILESMVGNYNVFALGNKVEFDKKNVEDMDDSDLLQYFLDISSIYYQNFKVHGGNGFHRDYGLVTFYEYSKVKHVNALDQCFNETVMFFDPLVVTKEEIKIAVEFRRAVMFYKYAIKGPDDPLHGFDYPKFYFVFKQFFYDSYWYIKYFQNRSGFIDELKEKTKVVLKLCIEEMENQMTSGDVGEYVGAKMDTDPAKDKDFIKEYTGSTTITIPRKTLLPRLAPSIVEIPPGPEEVLP